MRQTLYCNLILLHLAFFVVEIFSQNIKQEPIEFQNNEILLSGNLFLPASEEKVPAVVILHGSGPDEGLEYKVYANEFAKAGIATLVFDKRGSGKSGGDWRKRPLEFMANDALSAVEFLRNRKEIDQKKIGLWGISQGGWTAGKAAAQSNDVAFIVEVAGNAVSPAQQEIWHKDNMYQNLAYSGQARDTARKFWQMIFDWLVLVDTGKFPLPAGVLESELSGISVGMNYNALPDWAKIKQPVLLIHGEYDKLSPANESVSRISRVLTENGNLNFTYKIFPKSSHTITTNKTGLEFDWDEHFAFGYFKFTTDWILAATGQKTDVPQGDSQKIEPDKEFDESGKFGSPPIYGRAYSQLVLMIFFPLTFLIGLILTITNGIKNKDLISILLSFICLLNLCLILGFFVFLATSIFPQGMSIWQEYSIPSWQKFLPFIGLWSLIFNGALLTIIAAKRKSVSRLQIILMTCSIIFLPWLYYWNLIGYRF